MFSKKFKFAMGALLASVLGVSIVELAAKSSSASVILPRGTDFLLNFSGKQISDATSSYSGEKTATVNTNNGNPITIKAANVIANDGGWQTVLPGGYFYNPIDNTANHNKISGMSSIAFTSGSAATLSLHYGYTIDGSSVVYSRKVDLVANTPYSFTDGNPSYFYLKNEGQSNVNISNFTINYSCVDSGYNKQNLNVLMIGNSFSDDTIFFASRIAASYGITLNVFDAYIGNCSIDTHYTNLTNNVADYTGKTIVNGSFYNMEGKTLTQILGYTSWDVITFQQASAYSGVESSYANLSNLVSAVRGVVGNKPVFDWYQTWSYDSGLMLSTTDFSQYSNDPVTMYNAINTAYTSQVASLGVFNEMIPSGTVVQNTRTSYMKETFTRDFKHMSSFEGRYLVGLNFVSSILNIDLDMSPCTFKPSLIDDSFVNVAKESIRNAYRAPMAVTNSAYAVKEVAGYDLTQYTEIDAELVGCSFWNSQDSSNYNKRQANVNGTSNKYVTTKRFTSTDLPVGSLVVIGDGFGVRPEAWVTDAQQSSRPAETGANLIEVTSSFFSGYTYRAFNVFKIGTSLNDKIDLKGQYYQIFDTFHIYVPTASLGSIQPKGYNSSYETDKIVMKNNHVNIDAFDRMHLDPITGFYNCSSSADLNNGYSDDNGKKFMCSVPFYSARNDLPENTVIIVDTGYQWRSDAWKEKGTNSSRPANVTSMMTMLDSSFWTGFRIRTFNVSSISSAYVGQNHIEFFNHMRIYIPNTDDVYLETEDGLTIAVKGSAQTQGMLSYMMSTISMAIVTSGDDTSHVSVTSLGKEITTDGYTYNKNTGNITIRTVGNIEGYDYSIGNITGHVNRANESIENVGVDGSVGQFIKGNGSITLSSKWFNRCNYSSNGGSNAVWQRRYGSGWTYNANSANQDNDNWTRSDSLYRMEEDYSTGLRIAGSGSGRTAFILRSDLNNGKGIKCNDISVWFYNPNGLYYTFQIFVYTSASTASGDHVIPSGNYQTPLQKTSADFVSGSWINWKVGFAEATVYNIALFFQSSTNDATYVNLGHITLY